MKMKTRNKYLREMMQSFLGAREVLLAIISKELGQTYGKVLKNIFLKILTGGFGKAVDRKPAA